MTATELAALIRQQCMQAIPGTRLPGREELAAYFHCPESVVRAAIKLLADEGLLTPRKRSGCIVRRIEQRPAISRVHVLTNSNAFQPVLQGMLLGADNECRVRNIEMRIDCDPPAALDFAALAALDGGDPVNVGWIIATKQLPADSMMYMWLSEGLPFVIVDDYPSAVGMNIVTRDCRRAVFLATEKLIRLGHRRIVLAGPRKGFPIGDERVAGFMLGHEHCQVQPMPDPIIWWPAEAPRIDDLVAARLQADDPPTGIVAADQFIGCRILNLCRDRGVAVPGQLSLISAGFHPELEPENLHMLSRMDEGRPQRMGQMAVQLLLESQLTGKPMALWLESTYVDRGSTAPPAKASST